jgi:hypothetical protein
MLGPGISISESFSSSFSAVFRLASPGNRREVRFYQPSLKQPRTKDDDDEEDWDLTLNTY